jgi:hypothetical protein
VNAFALVFANDNVPDCGSGQQVENSVSVSSFRLLVA